MNGKKKKGDNMDREASLIDLIKELTNIVDSNTDQLRALFVCVKELKKRIEKLEGKK